MTDEELIKKMTVDKIPEDAPHAIRIIQPYGVEHAGDLKMIWDSENDDEIAVLEKQFDELKKKGWNAYSVRKNGEKGRMIKTFDPDAEKIIMAPPMQGG